MKPAFYLGIGLLALLLGARPAAAQYNWTGGYLGVNAGGAWGNSDVRTGTVFSPTGYFAASSATSIHSAGKGSVSPGGFTGGTQGGYNWQTGSLVLGLEADFEYLGQDSTRSVGPIVYPCCSPTTYSLKQKLKTDNLFTLRPRAGWAMNNWLFYGTAGLAVSSINTSFAFTDTFATAHASGSKTSIQPGWVVGAGVEYGLTPRWTLRGEYLYADLSEVTVKSNNLGAFTPSIPFPTNGFTHKADLAANIFRVALNFKF